MKINERKIKGRIVEKFRSQRSFAKEMKWSERTLSLKLNGLRSWKHDDICKACKVLDISRNEILDYFFIEQ